MGLITLRTLYPQNRVVSSEWVLSQGFDAKVNAAVDEHVARHGVFEEDGSYEAFVAGIAAPNLEESIELLEDLGLVTFARR